MRLYTAINLLLEANLLNEHILNVGKFQDRYRKEDYIDKVIDMLEKSYAAIGGIKGIDRDELMDDKVFWKVVRLDGKVVACMVYKFSIYGRKIVCGGTDGSPAGKAGFKMIMNEDKKMCDRIMCWTEVSGAPKHIYEKIGLPKIPLKSAIKILADLGKTIEEPGKEDPGYSYIRMIGGQPLEKTMFGFCPDKYR